ncbi:MAG: hypothetical protein PHW82_03825 [Bacteroidales bacterium]|nr:hypothetical protein [Bacteroidales bacterium]
MNEEYNKVLQKLNENIANVILLYNKEKEHCNELSKEVRMLNEELNIYKNKYKEIDNKYENLKLAKAINSEVGDSEAKIKLNRIIREIDNCIALLNK